DCYVNTRFTEAFQKLLKTLAPIVTKDSSATASIFNRPIICPRVHFKNPCSFSATVAEDLVRPPAFKVTATPNTDATDLCKSQCAVHPATAAPFRRAHIPIRMIVERNEHELFGNPCSSQ